MAQNSGQSDTQRSSRTQKIRPSQRARRTDSNPYAGASTRNLAGFTAATRSLSPVRPARVDQARALVNAPGYDLDRSFRAAMAILIRDEL